jgi:hypothetical protein
MSNFDGAWQNQYGSVLTLVSDGEALFGTYTSSTGSTGAYYVVGFGSTDAATQSHGIGVALGILWRSYEQGTPDPSWHWVSGFGGQLIVESSGVPNIILNHDLVATDNFPGVGNVGSYIDKLVYVPTSIGKTSSPKQPQQTNVVPDPINGTWQCTMPQPGLALQLQMFDVDSGFIAGNVQLSDGQVYPLMGFADSNAKSQGLSLEGIACTVSLGKGVYIAFSGWLDLKQNQLVLLQQTSQGTAASVQYMQTSVQTIYLSPA